jgi:hypothetical protein
MTEQGLSRSRLADLYYDLMHKERNKIFNTKVDEIGKSQLIQSIITHDKLTSYAIPAIYMKGTNSFYEDYTYTSFAVHSDGLLADIRLEWKFLDDQYLTLVEKCRLISKSRLVKYNGGTGQAAVTPYENAIDRRVLKYHSNYHYEFLYYVQEYGFIPQQIYLDLPDKFSEFKLTDEEFDTLTQLQNYYPNKLDYESSVNLDKFLRHHNADISTTINLYKKLHDILDEISELKNTKLAIQRTFDIDSLFDIISTEPKDEYSADNNDILYDKQKLNIEEQIRPITDWQVDDRSEFSLPQEEDLEFVYEYNDNQSLGSDYDYADMDCDILYGT